MLRPYLALRFFKCRLAAEEWHWKNEDLFSSRFWLAETLFNITGILCAIRHPKRAQPSTETKRPTGNSRLPMALKTMELMNTDLALLTETKLVKDLHTLGGYGYTVCATESKNTHQGGVALCYEGGQRLAHRGCKKVWPKCDWGILGIRELATKYPWSLHPAERGAFYRGCSQQTAQQFTHSTSRS